MNFQELKFVVGQIKKRVFCECCNGKYLDEDIEMIGMLGDFQSYFHAWCPACQTEAVVNVIIDVTADGTILIQDIIIPRLARLGTAPRGGKIESDEVLDMHNFLKDFNGDFTGAFKDKKSS